MYKHVLTLWQYNLNKLSWALYIQCSVYSRFALKFCTYCTISLSLSLSLCLSLCLSFSFPLSPSPLSPFPLQHNIEVEFSVWDMAGQEVYYATHQCFLSRNTLYLVVWNMEEKEKGIDYLRPWLLNIQASSTNFPCMSVYCIARCFGKVVIW